MNLINIVAYPGRNIYAHFPVVRVIVDLGEYMDIPTCDIPGFNDKLIAMLPGLREHKCSRGYVGGFLDRLEKGTYLAHIMEHASLEIQKQLGFDVSFGKARFLEKETIYYVVFEYINEIAGYESGMLAFNILDSILNNKGVNIEKNFDIIRNKMKENELGPSTKAIIDEARKRKIPITRIGNDSLIQLGYGKYNRKIQATLSDKTSCIAVDTACNKELTNYILSIKGIPVPEGESFYTFAEAREFIDKLRFPVVIKPYNGNQGKGVSLGINNFKDAETAFNIALQYSDKVLVERFIIGQNYRIAVVNDKVVAVSKRICANVIGDGKSTLKQLIDRENQNPLRGEGHEKPLTKIKIDDVMMLLLDKNGINLEHVPPFGEVVYLRENDNLSTGGTAIDATEEIHPENIRLAINAVNAIGLDIAGVDMVAIDISKPIREYGGAVIEVNACPGIRMHHFPSKGIERNVAKEIVNMLYPEGASHSIPIFAITGTNGKTTTTRIIEKIMKEDKKIVGMTSTGGVYIDGELIVPGDTTGPRSAQAILMDNRVDVAVLETARGGLINRGLAYDKADIGIITNISDDHLGIDGVNTLEEMADVKSLVVEAVKKEGYAVLNADDKFTPQIVSRVKSNIIYFSESFENPIIQNHIENKGLAVYLKNNVVIIYDGIGEINLMKINEIPATLNGLLKHNVQNSLASIAATYAHGVDIDVIRQALRKFTTDEKSNQGRFNIFDVRDFKVILDYGHNIDGINTVLSAIDKIKQNKAIGVIGTPGDRTDISILKIGEICGKYLDYIYVKEDKDTRGRKIGEVANILRKGCAIGGAVESCTTIELCEVTALERAMEQASKDDIIIVFYEKYYPLLEAIKRYQNNEVKQIQSEVI
ncbi:cyanophycin synthetase [Serpentinicella alkaliphila]|uniref:Cyanophycin synthetase n=1 Tax=Serpentinicella alkaliphila TaxID=1734049 RepID=A0A4V2T3T8_9FIRM|nr:cyanophycin synthetase [Serpentinicella alkaliphila]QUH24633.1 cyanophycin synthetase [Serpentinicella alkaliphila]TCQ02634.1 cyanophycin synthetase [Serpentinicella alkaliphila]